MKFYEEIECEHGWTDELGYAHCRMGSGCSIEMESFCTEEDCPLVDPVESEDENERMERHDD